MVHPATILLLEDDRHLREGTAELLALADIGYELTILQAMNGLEGLAILRHELPNLIISDIAMPAMDGRTFLEEVRKNHHWLDIPFIFLTAKGTKQEILQGRLSGAELYITKPFEADELITLVKSQLDRTAQLHQVRERTLNDLKANILQVLNHELRTPLTYVTGFSDMLVNGIKMEKLDALQSYLMGIQTGCRRLMRLVNDLIAIIELRTGEAVNEFWQHARIMEDVGERLRSAGTVREADARSKGIAIHYTISDNLPPILGVPSQLSDIFNRLIDNAIRFTSYPQRPDKTVHLSIQTGEQNLVVTISDNGIGFPPHVQKKIFDLFYQHNRQRLEQQGTGSGLPIVKRLVELHGGYIQVQSKENIGSTFRLFFPIYNPQQPLEHLHPPQWVTVLIVEDDHHLLQGLREILESYESGSYRFHVIMASNGLEAIRILPQHLPDLIISDVMMPHMNGFALLENVRQNPDWVHIPFIFLTALTDRQDIRHGLSQGAEQYIAKPYDMDELLALVTTQLNRYYARQDVYQQGYLAFKDSILKMLQPEMHLPLSYLNFYSQQLNDSLQKADSDASLKNSLEGLQLSSQSLTRLIEAFILLTEIKTGEAANAFQYRAGAIEGFGGLVGVVAMQYRDAPELAEVRFHLDLPALSPPIYGDIETLQYCIAQLHYTAMQLAVSSKTKEVFIALTEQKEKICLSAVVAGVQLPAEDAEKLQALFTGNDEAALTIPEYGLIFTAINGIINLHKGQIEIDNGEKGCRFTFVLPAYRPPNT